MFNTVEGNSTFYAIPSQSTFERWAAESAEEFRFALKFPRVISHERELNGCEEELSRFMAGLDALAAANRLGPTFLQLGPKFGPERLSVLKTFVSKLSTDIPWAVEVRHFEWFDHGPNESRLNELLINAGIDKVLFDSRPLYQAPPDDEIEAHSQTRKPKTPVRQTVTGRRPMLRIVGRNRVELVDRFYDQWAAIVAGWIRMGLEPYVFTHAPDDARAPQLARRFAERLNREFQADKKHQIRVDRPPMPPEQLSLL